MDPEEFARALEDARQRGDKTAMADLARASTEELPPEGPGEAKRFRFRHAPGMIGIAFEPAEQRCATYPSDLPFLPGVRCGLTTVSAEQRSLQWFGGDLERHLASLLEQCHAEGWEEAPGLRFPTAMGARVHILDRGDMTRHIMAITVKDTSMISLTESPRRRRPPDASGA
jgi:hypothetical protein